MSASSSSPKSKHWLLAKSRQWHTWCGLIAGVFLLVVGTSGIVLNYKKPVFTALGLEQTPARPDKQEKREKGVPAPRLATGSDPASMPVSIEHAFQLARKEWGDVPLEKIELKPERGELIYKLKQQSGPEIWINAATGEHFTKGAYERFGKPVADDAPKSETDWGRILLDLHTGKIGGEAGKAVMSVAALLLVFLSLSGVYMWAKPMLIRRSNSRAKALTTAPHPVSAMGSTTPAAARKMVAGVGRISDQTKSLLRSAPTVASCL